MLTLDQFLSIYHRSLPCCSIDTIQIFVRDDLLFLEDGLNLTGGGEVHDSGAHGESSVEIMILPLEIGILLLRDPLHHEMSLDDDIKDIMRRVFDQ